MRYLYFFFYLLLCWNIHSQSLYFPPTTGNTWEKVDPTQLGWCTDKIPALYNYLEKNNSKAFIVLQDGKIVLEKYFGTFTADSIWYWASAGKSLIGFLTGMQQEDGLLDIQEPTSKYLGTGWTSCTSVEESNITILHQLTMTTGLDDQVQPDNDCTLDSCLKCIAPPSTRWAYHNAPYTLLHDVLEAASGKKLNAYISQNLTPLTGITGLYLKNGWNSVFYSKPRMAARFGLLMLGGGAWNGTKVLADSTYFYKMIHPSQSINLAYGYLWWLNGQSSFKVPGLQISFPGPMLPAAPPDLYAAEGKNGQIINVVPTKKMVVVRMGDAPNGQAISLKLNDSIWVYLNPILCTTSMPELEKDDLITIAPNPVCEHFMIQKKNIDPVQCRLVNNMGQIIRQWNFSESKMDLNVLDIPDGFYYLDVRMIGGRRQVVKVVVGR